MIAARRVFAVGALALAAGCAASLSSSSSEHGAVEVRYTIEHVRADPPRVRVTIETPAAAGGVTDFHIAERWGGVEGFDQGLTAVRITRRGGAGLPIERPNERQWRVRTAPSEPLVCTYELKSTDELLAAESSSYYRPVVTSRLFHAIGHTFLLVPMHLEGDAPRAIDVRWLGFAEAGWPVVCSFSADANGFRVTRSMDEFVHSVFFAGAIRLHRVAATGGELMVAMAGSDWEFTDDQFVQLARRVVDVERAFFGDGAPYFLITVLPVGDKDPHQRSLGGTGLVTSFALFMRPNTRLELEPDLVGEGVLGVSGLLAHELFHHWNGGVIQRVEPDELTYWFSEGFTDFYTRRLLHRAGLLTLDEHVASLNASLATYTRSPVRNAANDVIVAEFWTNPDVQKLPYRRGDLVALAVDARIRARSNGARSLDDVMKDLRRAAEVGGPRMSTDSFLAAFARETSPDFSDLVRQWVVNGDTVTFEPDVLAPCLDLGVADGVPRFTARPGAGDACRSRL